MRMALLADLHANLEAFRACLEHAQQQVDRYAFLGDLVGYGADPAPVVELVMRQVAQGAVAVLGNHDQAVALGPSASMTAEASQAIKWTRSQLSVAQLNFLGGLPLTVAQGNCLYVHANAWNPGGWEYLTSGQDVGRSLAATTCRQTFCGHVHRPALYHLSPGGSISHFEPVAGTGIPLGSRRRWLAIAGSVGQPRDGIPAASYATFDDQSNLLTFFRVPYDTAEAARKVRAAGLPEALGRRLEAGG